MPDIIYDDVRDGQPLPMSALEFVALVDDTGTQQFYRIEFLEAESEWRLAQVTQPNDTGGVRPVAYRLDITAVVMFNNYQDLRPMLNSLAQFGLANGSGTGQVVVRIELDPAEMGYYWPSRIMQVGTRLDFPGIQANSVTWDIGSVEARPRLSIRISQLMDIQVLNSSVSLSNGVMVQIGDGWNTP
jgi:hypothetical protein